MKSLPSLAAGTVLLPLALLTVPPASAYSCASVVPDALDRYQVVFVGHVTDVDFGTRVLTVQVDEVWKGGSVPAVVTMPAPEIGWGNWGNWGSPKSKRTSYVFAPDRTTSGTFELPICRDWMVDADFIREHRPAVSPLDLPTEAPRSDAASAPEPPDDSNTQLTAGIAAGVVLAGAGATVAWRRRRTD